MAEGSLSGQLPERLSERLPERLKEQLFEQRFWLQIMGDHARILLSTLHPQEEQLIEQAQLYQREFDLLLTRARAGQVAQSTSQQLATDFLRYKQLLLRGLLYGTVKLMLPPTFLNHMINELEEYLRMLAGQPSTLLATHHLWATDGKGHALQLISDLDPTEKIRKKLLKKIKEAYATLAEKVREYQGYQRAGNLPMLPSVNREAGIVNRLFVKLLQELLQFKINNQLLGRIEPLIFDHMIREECYYLLKIGQQPPYPPDAPRISA